MYTTILQLVILAISYIIVNAICKEQDYRKEHYEI